MNETQLLNIVTFCILMEGHGGIITKAPSYIKEKFRYCLEENFMADGILDNWNRLKLEEWKKLWLWK